MKNWMSRCAALIGTVLSLSSFAQDCQEISLYKNGENGALEETMNSFPERPEWVTNWGEMDGMTPPYIRFSGMKDRAGDWSGLLSFEGLPQKIHGGFLKVKVRSSQKGNVGFWLQGPHGASTIVYKPIEANRTTQLEIPIASFSTEEFVQVQKIGVGLFDVPAFQYTILFLDDIVLTCASAQNFQFNTLDDAQGYVYSDLRPGTVTRSGKFTKGECPKTSAAYSREQRRATSDSTVLSIVVSASEHEQIKNYAKALSLTPLQSTKGWFRNMFFLDRNRLKDSVIANPKALYYEAGVFAAEEKLRSMPILIGNVDYGYRACVDSACKQNSIQSARLLLAGLPTAFVRGSKIRLHYDPYFVSTNRNALPTLQIYANGKWNEVPPKTELEVNFESAGNQSLAVRLSEGGVSVEQNIFVEVR